jgi:hypothetical protein
MEIQVVGGVYSVEDQGALDGAKHAFLLGKNLA